MIWEEKNSENITKWSRKVTEILHFKSSVSGWCVGDFFVFWVDAGVDVWVVFGQMFGRFWASLLRPICRSCVCIFVLAPPPPQPRKPKPTLMASGNGDSTGRDGSWAALDGSSPGLDSTALGGTRLSGTGRECTGQVWTGWSLGGTARGQGWAGQGWLLFYFYVLNLGPSSS
jgi:hypothetical protein